MIIGIELVFDTSLVTLDVMVIIDSIDRPMLPIRCIARAKRGEFENEFDVDIGDSTSFVGGGSSDADCLCHKCRNLFRSIFKTFIGRRPLFQEVRMLTH